MDEQVVYIHSTPVQPSQFQIEARQFFILPDSGFFVAYHFYFIGPPDEYRGAWLDKNLNKYREDLLITNEAQTEIKFYEFGQGPFKDSDIRIKAKYFNQ